MKHKQIISVGVWFLLIASAYIGLSTHMKHTGNDCGESAMVVKKIYTFYEWHSAKEQSWGPTCIGPTYYTSYRPLDISIILIVASLAIIYFAKKK